MVVAYLRGLLRNHKFGSRSMATEEIILEALSAELLAKNIESGTASDLAILPLLTPESITKTTTQVADRLGRAAELRLLDIYKVADQISGNLKRDNSKNELSLYQVYQIAEKTGIFEAFDEHYNEDDFKPLL